MQQFVQFQVDEVSNVEKKLSVQVQAEYIAKKIERAYQTLKGKSQVHGFRPGKAPRSVLERIYKDEVNSRVIHEVLVETLEYALKEAQLSVVGQPVIEEIKGENLTGPLSYLARIEIYPSVEVVDYKDFEVNQRELLISDDEIQKHLKFRRESMMELIPIEGRSTLSAQDVVRVQLTGKAGPHEYKNQEMQFDLSKPEWSPIPGLVEAIVGLPIDAKNALVTWVPSLEAKNTSWEGKEISLRISLVSANQKQLPELNDEFAKDTGEAATLSELMEKVREQLTKEEKNLIQKETRNALLAELVKRNPIVLPPLWIKALTSEYVKTQTRAIAMRLMSEGKNLQSLTKEEVETAARSMVEYDVAVELLLRALAQKEGIEVTDADIEHRLSTIAKDANTSVLRVRAELQKDDPQLYHFRMQLMNEKAAMLIENLARISGKESAD